MHIKPARDYVVATVGLPQVRANGLTLGEERRRVDGLEKRLGRYWRSPIADL